VFSIQAWDLALISSAKQPLQGVMMGVVTQKLREVFGKHFFERVLQVGGGWRRGAHGGGVCVGVHARARARVIS